MRLTLDDLTFINTQILRQQHAVAADQLGDSEQLKEILNPLQEAAETKQQVAEQAAALLSGLVNANIFQVANDATAVVATIAFLRASGYGLLDPMPGFFVVLTEKPVNENSATAKLVAAMTPVDAPNDAIHSVFEDDWVQATIQALSHN